jgi:hypothetical protein
MTFCISLAFTSGLALRIKGVAYFTKSKLSETDKITQIPIEYLEKHIDEQRLCTLAFISGRFVRSAYNWSVPEIEAFAIVEAMTRVWYLTLVRTVHLHTDHRNLVYIFDPRRTNPIVANRVVSKLNRRGAVLSEFDYDVYHHIQGELNQFADLMTR